LQELYSIGKRKKGKYYTFFGKYIGKIYFSYTGYIQYQPDEFNHNVMRWF